MKDPVEGEKAFSGGFSVTLVADQLRRRVPGGIGVYALGLMQGFAEACASFPEEEKDRGICADLRFNLLASKKKPDPDPLGDFMASWGAEGNNGDALFRLSEKTPNSRAFMAACRFGLLSLPKSDLLAATSLVVPKHGGTVSVAVHDLAFRDVPESFTAHGRKWHEAALKKALERADGFSVPTVQMAHRVREMTDKPAAVIGYGCDHLPEPDFDGAQIILRTIFGKEQESGHKLLLAVGTLEPRKNLERIAKAFSAAKTSYDGKVSLLVIGPRGWGPQSGVAGDGVYLLGAVSPGELAAFYGMAYALIYIPILEGYGLPVAEAFYAGVPVVSSDVPSAGGATLLADPLNEADMAEKILMLLRDSRLRDGLIAKGQERLSGQRWRDIALQHLLFWRYLQARRVNGKEWENILGKSGIHPESRENNNLRLSYEGKDLSYGLEMFV